MRPSFVLRAAALLLLAACATEPGTGRSQFRFTSMEAELSLGEEAYAEELKDARTINSGPDYDMVQRVAQRLAESAVELYPEESSEFQWEVVLIDDPKMVNAWCLPGGKMAVYTGLLPVTQDEAGLAVVMGHEVGHAVARHGGERMSQQLTAQVLLGAAALSMKDMDSGERDAVMVALVGAGTYGVLNPFSRTQENSADEIGLFMSARAGYDPRAALGLWKRMGETGGDSPPEILSTHPSDETRLAHMEELMPQALEYYEVGLADAKKGMQPNMFSH